MRRNYDNWNAHRTVRITLRSKNWDIHTKGNWEINLEESGEIAND